MGIRMTVHVPRRRPRPEQVDVTWQGPATAAHLAAALADVLTLSDPHLSVGGVEVPAHALVGMPPLLDGVSVVVHSERVPVTRSSGYPVLDLAVTAGPDAGQHIGLAPGTTEVGRAASCALRIEDRSLSRRHARFALTTDGVTVEDLGSSNGVSVAGVPVTSPTVVDTASEIRLGATSLRLRRRSGAGVLAEYPGDGTAVLHSTAGEKAVGPEHRSFRLPPLPARSRAGRMPWLTVLVPIPIAVVLAIIYGPQLLAFVLIGPVMMLLTAVTDRRGSARSYRQECRDHAATVEGIHRAVAAAVADQAHQRHRAFPDPHLIRRVATGSEPGLWARGGPIRVRVGLGDEPSAVAVVDDEGTSHPTIGGAPVVVDLVDAGMLGVVGDLADRERFLTALIGQAVVRYPPTELHLRFPFGSTHFEWVPHHRRTGEGLVVLIVPDVAVAGARAMCAAAREEGAVVVVGADAADELPRDCPAIIVVRGGTGDELIERGQPRPIVADGASAAWGESIARAVTPLRPALAAAAGLPRHVTLSEVWGQPTTASIRAAWERDSGPVAAVGQRRGCVYRLDLRRDGPHVLIGGTTGSGKSEFLRTLVTALALDSSPEQVSLLLVDFKGGSAFGPCARLPHVVGLVTDLDGGLVDRVLTSLLAEIRRRERVLAAAGAADLEAYRGLSGHPPLPRLVVVIDELRAVVDEHPGALAGLIRLAALGRSLGIHLVLATQRPAGTITAEVAANVNLRIAFRVRDTRDSHDVIDDPIAATISPAHPGRAVSRGGDDELVEFQSAIVAPTSVGPEPARVWVHPLGQHSRASTADAPCANSSAPSTDDREAALAGVVATITEVANKRGRPALAPPWLPPLPARVTLSSALWQPGSFAIVDDPSTQRQFAWTWDDGLGPLRIVGASRTGRTGAALALAVAAAERHGPDDLHIHAFGSPDLIEILGTLPQVGTTGALSDAEAITALLEHLEGRTALGSPRTLLVIDGWDVLAEADDLRAADPLSERVFRAIRQGSRTGLTTVVTGGRTLLGGKWSALGGDVVILGAPDPLDAALLGLPPSVRGRGTTPVGRGRRAGDGLELHFLSVNSTHVQGVAGRAGSAGAQYRPWRFSPLPDQVPRAAIEPPAAGFVLAVAGPQAKPWAWNPSTQGRRLLVVGPSRSGRTSALVALGDSVASAGTPVVLITSAPVMRPWRLSPNDLDALVVARRDHPDLVVLVDDADRLDDSPLLPVLREIESLLERDHGALAAASSESVSVRMRGLDVDLARSRPVVLLWPDRSLAQAFGEPGRHLPGRAHPGRGLVLDGSSAVPLQVLAPSRLQNPRVPASPPPLPIA